MKTTRARKAPPIRLSGGELLDNAVWFIALLTLFVVPVLYVLLKPPVSKPAGE